MWVEGGIDRRRRANGVEGVYERLEEKGEIRIAYVCTYKGNSKYGKLHV